MSAQGTPALHWSVCISHMDMLNQNHSRICWTLVYTWVKEPARPSRQTSIHKKSLAGLLRHWRPLVCWLTWVRNVLSFQSNFISLCVSFLAFSALIEYKHWETHQLNVSFQLRCPPIFPKFIGPAHYPQELGWQNYWRESSGILRTREGVGEQIGVW